MKNFLPCRVVFLLFLYFSLSVSLITKVLASDDKEEESDVIIIPETLLNIDGESVSSDLLKRKYIGLYFSASWCGPCRKFTPRLIEFRNKFVDDFEVILIGADGSAKAQANYMKKYSMPWLAMKNQSPEAKQASKVSGVEFIPYLVVINSSGKIISKNGKAEISTKGFEAMEYWKKL
tara:strand:- start:498 stop:1028 length:531 start_codon:yes stop_codon:yes gene_type:complete